MLCDSFFQFEDFRVDGFVVESKQFLDAGGVGVREECILEEKECVEGVVAEAGSSWEDDLPAAVVGECGKVRFGVAVFAKRVHHGFFLVDGYDSAAKHLHVRDALQKTLRGMAIEADSHGIIADVKFLNHIQN